MNEITEKIKYIKINKRKRNNKKYLISEESRKKLKTINKKFIVIIPYYTIVPQILDEKKPLFICTTNIITDIYSNLIFIEKELDDENTNKKIIKEFIINTFNLKTIKNEFINKLLEVENKKIFVYSINLGKKIKIINNFLITNHKEKIKNKNEQELSLDIDIKNKYFKKLTYLGFYKNKENLISDENPVLDNSIIFNKYILKKLNKLNIYDDINIEFRNSIFFNH